MKSVCFRFDFQNRENIGLYFFENQRLYTLNYFVTIIKHHLNGLFTVSIDDKYDDGDDSNNIKQLQ